MTKQIYHSDYCLRPVEVSEYYINRVASGMSKYFWDNIFKEIFDILKDNNTVYNYNPYHDKKGRFCSAIMAKMPKLADYKNPTKDYELSLIPQEFLDKLGKVQKPLVLKKNIIEKNKNNHPEIGIEEYNDVLYNAIYKADLIIKVKPKIKQNYYTFINVNKENNQVSVIELSDEKEQYEIINFFRVDTDRVNSYIKRANVEGGDILITERDNSQGAAHLSALNKGSDSIITHIDNNFNPVVNNSKDDVINAIRNGSIWYENGAFRTKTRFLNAVASTLESVGAKFSRNAYYIPKSQIPFEYVTIIDFVAAQATAKANRISNFLAGLGSILSQISLKQYIEATVDLMYRKLEVDILKSAQEKKVPIIELGIVQPKVKFPKAQTKNLENYWKAQDKKAEKINKDLEKAREERDKAQKEANRKTKDKNGKREDKTDEEKAADQKKLDDAKAKVDDLNNKLADQNKDAFENAPQVDFKLDDLALDEKSKKIAQDYTYNMEFWVKKWEAKNISLMRQDILKMIGEGARVPRIQEYFEKRWKIAKDKAHFLAVNESHLAASVIKAADYQAMGAPGYIWGRSSSKEKRELHKHYYGQFFTWEDKPIIDEKSGIRGYPRQVWNCKCHMLIKPPTLTEIMNKYIEVRNAKRNIFKRIWNSTQCNNNAWRYRRFGQGKAF